MTKKYTKFPKTSDEAYTALVNPDCNREFLSHHKTHGLETYHGDILSHSIITPKAQSIVLENDGRVVIWMYGILNESTFCVDAVWYDFFCVKHIAAIPSVFKGLTLATNDYSLSGSQAWKVITAYCKKCSTNIDYSVTNISTVVSFGQHYPDMLRNKSSIRIEL